MLSTDLPGLLPPPFLKNAARVEEFQAVLDAHMHDYISHWLAASSSTAYARYVKYWVQFCAFYGYPAIAPSEHILCRYVTHLAFTCAFKTIKNYLQGVRIVHRELNLPNPLDNRFNLERLLRGIRRVKGDSERRKFAVTPAMLSEFFLHFDFSNTIELAIYAAMLVAFFGFFRKGNVTIDSQQAAENVTFFRRSDFFFAPDDSVVWVLVRQTKTIQFFERELRIPLMAIPGSVLCPVSALCRLFLAVPAPHSAHAFSYQATPTRLNHLTHSTFVSRFKSLVARIGFDASLYSGHSFRRGGATFAFSMGVPGELIQLQGDWLSNAYLLYLVIPSAKKAMVTLTMSRAIQNGCLG